MIQLEAGAVMFKKKRLFLVDGREQRNESCIASDWEDGKRTMEAWSSWGWVGGY